MVTVTEVGVLTRPLLSVTVKLNVRVIVVVKVGATKVGFAVFGFGFRVTKGSDTWFHEYDTIVAPLVVAKLDEPTNLTVSPPLTAEDGNTEATATGADWVGLVNGTHTPFCSIDPGGHKVVVGTHTPFCSTVPIGQVPVGTLLFSIIIQRFDCLNICLPVPKTA